MQTTSPEYRPPSRRQPRRYRDPRRARRPRARIRTIAIFPKRTARAASLRRRRNYLVGADRTPIEAYLDLEDVLRVARRARVDAIHPGTVSREKPEFAAACAPRRLHLRRARRAVMRAAGQQGRGAGPGAGRRACRPFRPPVPLPRDLGKARRSRRRSAIPLMLKASRGGGGRGVRVVEAAAELPLLTRRRGARPHRLR